MSIDPCSLAEDTRFEVSAHECHRISAIGARTHPTLPKAGHEGSDAPG